VEKNSICHLRMTFLIREIHVEYQPLLLILESLYHQAFTSRDPANATFV
jgi:hypothetical protein